MSMPAFPQSKDIVSREEALDAILMSIAAEETALSHILNAESEKIAYVVDTMKRDKRGDTQDLLAVNESASALIDRVNDMQLILKNKLRLAVSCMPPCPPPEPLKPPKPPCPPPEPLKPPCPPPEPLKPPCPPPEPLKPPCPPPEDCVSIFSADTRHTWHSGKTPVWAACARCCDGVALAAPRCDAMIRLPGGARYKIRLAFTLINRAKTPVCIEAALYSGGKPQRVERFTPDAEKRHVSFHATLLWETPGRHHSQLAIRLCSDADLRIREGFIAVEKVYSYTHSPSAGLSM